MPRKPQRPPRGPAAGSAPDRLLQDGGKSVLHRDEEKIEIPPVLPVLPLRDVVLFPHMIYPLLVGRAFSVEALQKAMMEQRLLLLVSQRRPDTEEPEPRDLHKVGVVARVLQVLKIPSGTLKVLVEGLVRGRVGAYERSGPYLASEVTPMTTESETAPIETEALSRHVMSLFAEYVRLNRRIPDEVLLYLSNIKSHSRLADTLSAHLLQQQDAKQRLLDVENVHEQFERLRELLQAEIEILKIEQRIDGTVRENLSRSQREFYLQQQLKAIKEELGQSEDGAADAEIYLRKLEEQPLPDEARARAREEIARLQKMHPYSPESGVVRSYLDWLLGLPWGKVTTDRRAFDRVRRILNEDHFGLDKPKRRIIEHLAVLRLTERVKGPILCLVGPPGVGKTSLGKSVARALDRKFVRMSLGGVRDEAEIRGHRRTYIGSLPGRIVQSLKKAGSLNPVFLLDEVDKIGLDFRGDPASALLEVLDPEQNRTFVDHYLEVELDLSQVLFITTANTTDGIPAPLVDRMELIRLPGYLEFEKHRIAESYLLPKLIREMGMESLTIEWEKDAVATIMRDYTYEAGVRELERQLATCLRHVAEEHVLHPRRRRFRMTHARIRKYLGVPRYHQAELWKRPAVGRAVGLAWTARGGTVLPIEVSLMPGAGKLVLTGQLGPVMKESAQAALSLVRANARLFRLDPHFFKDREIHVHVPEGAVPKDGPSAGITVAVALASALTQTPVSPEIAFTGELTLSGSVLPIGGLNEKVLAARRHGVKTIVLPDRNRPQLSELPRKLVKGLEFVTASRLGQVFKVAFPERRSWARVGA
jgi:ATP-dependent Lon protease